MPARLYMISLIVPASVAAAFADALAPFGASVALHELDEDGAPGRAQWRVEALGPAPDRARLGVALALAAAAAGVPEPAVAVTPLPDTDWLARNLSSFRALVAGRFIVHPAHDRPDRPWGAPGRIALCIEAGEAFGTGEHASTRGCLLALDALARRARRFARGAHALDMGCGSGVLALAMARAWRMPVLAVDAAPEAARVARANARLNGAGALVRALHADGYRARAVRARRYDLIAANILQRPLVAMAPAAAARLRAGGRLLLAGFQAHQAQAVIAAHRRRGLRLVRAITLGDWVTLVMRRPPVGNA